MISWTDLGRRWSGNVKARRRLLPAVWSTTFHRLFSDGGGEAAREETLLHELARPERPGSSVAMAVGAYDDRLVGSTALRLVGNNVLYARYRLDPTGQAAMRRLACRVEGHDDAQVAMRSFTRCRDLYGQPRERVATSAAALGSVEPADSTYRAAGVSEVTDSKSEAPPESLDPSNYLTYLDVSFDGTMSTCSFELTLPVHLDTIVDRVDPRTWDEADSVHFLETRVLEVKGGDAATLGPPGKTSWKGRYLERFALPWNMQMLSYFNVELAADVSIEKSEARIDYSLLREEDRQIVRDFGFVAVRTRPGYPNWTVVNAEKSTAYASPLLNALNPAVLGTWIQDQVRTFWRPLEPSVSSRRLQRFAEDDEDDEDE